MSETAAETTTETAEQAKPKSLEDTLAGLDEDARKFVLDQVGKARSEAQGLRKRLKDAEPDLKQLAELRQASQTEAERQQAALSEAQKRAEKAERDALRASVALRKGLPANLAARLQGDDEAALEADADELLSLVPQDSTPRAPRVDLSQGSSAIGAAATSPREQFAAIVRQHLGR